MYFCKITEDVQQLLGSWYKWLCMQLDFYFRKYIYLKGSHSFRLLFFDIHTNTPAKVKWWIKKKFEP